MSRSPPVLASPRPSHIDEGRFLSLTIWDADEAPQMFADRQVGDAIKRCELCDVLGIA